MSLLSDSLASMPDVFRSTVFKPHLEFLFEFESGSYSRRFGVPKNLSFIASQAPCAKIP